MLRESDKRVVRAFVNEKADSSNLLDTDGVKLDKMGLGGETVAKWINGRIAIVSTESAKSDESIIRLISKTAGTGVVDFSYARKGHRVHEHGAMGRNGRGLYHGTNVAKNDMVLHKDHRDRWRVDRITSSSGNHISVTGPAAGHPTAEAAATEARKAMHRLGTTGMLLIQDGDDYSVYEGHWNKNGPRTGILSDGTRINVYHDDTGSGDPWTAVPHGEEWDKQERRGMRPMLGMSETATGISEWSEGQEGRHLGSWVPWDTVPEGIKRHIERRVVSESMVANARRKKGVTVDDLPEEPQGKVLYCPSCHEQYSCARRDYFMMPKGEVLACQACEVPLVLQKRLPEPSAPPQEARHTAGNRAWDAAEDKGLVRMVVEPEQESYFDVYGEPDTQEERDEIVEQIERDGCNMFASQYRKRSTDPWETADSIGMIIGDLADSGYEDGLKQAALDALKKPKNQLARNSEAGRLDPALAHKARQIVKVIGRPDFLALLRGDHVRTDPHIANQMRQLVLVAGEDKLRRWAMENTR